ncbi:tyrosine/serine/threonine protein phosphatase pps1 [Apophysomyces sp. BC1034]|nr:tyrosine/serine/threonine protein phosphatase pps1 [Apophysomyces sp. BC1015]KAG0179545.1 tyrosine/serine/threonine protein phosphatase pps1 [Apophysomyces sp. BC1021]KAG0189898.1 tyrosine/serine/threonine protein phosphatase pps1 [Apophysomyces sp. BC1034]
MLSEPTTVSEPVTISEASVSNTTLFDSTSNAPGTQQLFDIATKHLGLVLQNDPLIYGISGNQYNDIQTTYSEFPLPNDILFPWLHGIDGKSCQQNLFFGIRRCITPQYRGLMLVHADETQPYKSRLAHSVLPSELLISNRSQFLQPNNGSTIDLRNFKTQVSRFATISDIVVYGDRAEEVAKRISNAQEKLREERMTELDHIKRTAGNNAVKNANRLIYRTFVIQDPFSLFEQQYPDLVFFDSNGIQTNSMSFWEREREEMRVMSSASEVTENIWMGNTQDAPASVQRSDSEDCPSDNDDNPYLFSICIESHDLADMPSPSTLTLARETLNDIPAEEVPAELIHLDVYSAGASLDTAAFEEFYTRLTHLLVFIDDQASRGRRILLHCSDGYTETSLLGLSWIMYKEKVPLPQAYLMLQKKRSFFVCAGDVATLKRIELLFQNEPPAMIREHKRKWEESSDGFHGSSDNTIAKLDVSLHTIEAVQRETVEDLAADEDNDVSKGDRTLHEDGYINSISNTQSILGLTIDDDTNEPMPAQLFSQSLPAPDEEEKARFPWFYSARFEGSFPSRILPILYLGNLNHATNEAMLTALNITHVVSVGENANIDPARFNLLYLDNLYDDGIDSIRGRLDETMRFIDTAREQGTQCLIHCRVGVSRSAAITICYVMKHLHYDLVQAYLYVRARRLNVIIQPNLKFMYEMLQLEQQLSGRTSITWPLLAKEIHLLNMSYHDQ